MKVKSEVNLVKGELLDLQANLAYKLINHGWASIVPDDRTLEQKLSKSALDGRTTYKELADIARDHFVEVAEKAANDWWASEEPCLAHRGTDHVINAIKKDGRKE